ncbi:MAG: deoxyhypusine synthase family protein, partial [Candidatus Hermodarchaeota archaeon]
MSEHRKEEYLIKKIIPFNVKKVKNVDDILKSLKYCGFQGRNLGRALDILEKMVTNSNCLTVLTLSGAMVPAGMGELICALMEHNLIDVLVTTGANIIHDIVDVFSNVGHYVGSSNVDDNELFQNRINRIYDVFLPEENYQNAEEALHDIIQKTFKDKEVHITPSKFLKIIGGQINKRSIISIAAKYNIPIFIPAFSDSELALNLIKYSVREGYNFQFDILEDVKNFGELIKNSKEYGTIV